MVRVQVGRKPLDDRAVVLGGNDPQLVNQSHRQRELYFNEMSQGLSAVLGTTLVSTCSTYHKKTHGERERERESTQQKNVDPFDWNAVWNLVPLF